MQDTMVRDQIEKRGISDARVLDAMRTVPRHRFVLDTDIDDAYGDFPLSIGCGQTISQPFIVAYMCELARFTEHDRVLEVGSGSGYHASIIAQLVDHVFSIEIVPDLAAQAESTVKALGYENISIRYGDGFYGWAEEAPFDVIVVTAASDYIPPPLINQLAEGGRLVIPLGPPAFTQELMLAEKHQGEIVVRDKLPVRFVPLTGRH
ncbi:MAG: protein-L-isoaspartate(D-aspartate) O-methyltransferase [Mariprofundaceae bacterium]